MAVKIKSILHNKDNWMKYKSTHIIRPVEEKEVEKMMACGDFSKGFSIYECPHCGEEKILPFRCNGKMCTTCGKIHADKWAMEVSKIFLDVIHRHVVFTIPDKLWPLMEEDRGSWKVLVDTVRDVLNKMIGKQAIPGILCVLHPFGKDLKFNPHAHTIVTEGGLNKQNQWVNINFWPYDKLRKIWQYHILTNLKKYFSKSKDISKLIDSMFKKYKKGFYVRAKDRIKKPKGLTQYIGRYIRHPAIAESRIVEFDPEENKYVTFYYKDDNKKKVYVTMTVNEFIEAVIKHIPEPNFKMVRWYGLYARTKWKKVKNLMVLLRKYNVLKEQYIDEKLKELGQIRCDLCGTVMDKVGDSFKGRYV